MRRMVLSLMSAAALTLAGCNAPSSTSASGASTPSGPRTAGSASTKNAPMPSEVTGTVALREPAPLSANARLDIRLVDVTADASASGPPLASKTVMPANEFPQTFQLSFDPAQVKVGDLYILQATLVDGDRHYTMPIQAPVLTKGHPNTATIDLVAQQTKGEKLLAAFTDVQKQLGGMKITRGTKLEKDSSRGWQLFRQAGEVKFIRELVDHTGKDFTSTDYAYRDGKPWVVEQQVKANSGAKASVVDRAGWDETGALVLKQHQVGGAMQELDADAAANLRKQAVDVLSLATNGKSQ